MGILNVTPDSFFDGKRYESVAEAVDQAEKMVREGATILDLGGQSTRPGSERIDAETEWQRIQPVLSAILQRFPEAIISVDTYHASVASQAVQGGAAIVNDVSGGTFDPAMFDTIARLQVPFVLMHMQGTPETMQMSPTYENVVDDVLQSLSERVNHLRQKGVHDIIIDPGFGFGKTVDHNYELLDNLSRLQLLGTPILAGLSRKSMINKVLEIPPDKALNGTTVLNTMALMNGADILRVHDVAEAVEAVKLFTRLKSVREKETTPS